MGWVWRTYFYQKYDVIYVFGYQYLLIRLRLRPISQSRKNSSEDRPWRHRVFFSLPVYNRYFYRTTWKVGVFISKQTEKYENIEWHRFFNFQNVFTLWRLIDPTSHVVVHSFSLYSNHRNQVVIGKTEKALCERKDWPFRPFFYFERMRRR